MCESLVVEVGNKALLNTVLQILWTSVMREGQDKPVCARAGQVCMLTVTSDHGDLPGL